MRAAFFSPWTSCPIRARAKNVLSFAASFSERSGQGWTKRNFALLTARKLVL